MEQIIKNPGDLIRGARLTGGAKPIEILVRFTQENIKKICGLHEEEKRFLQWLRCDVLQALDEPVRLKENFATMEVDKKVVKPPLGIMPEWLWKEKRIVELKQAMQRKIDDSGKKYAGLTFVEYIVACYNDETFMKWTKEYSKLLKEMEVIEIEKKLNIL